jgi:hypothetical protein
MAVIAFTLTACEGPIGPAGKDGKDGTEQGPKGDKGDKGDPGVGTPGTNGTNGTNGENGKDGKPAPKIAHLKLGDLDVFLEDQTGELAVAQIAIIQDVLNAFYNSTTSLDVNAMTNLNGRGQSLSIIIEKDPTYSGNFNVINQRQFAIPFGFTSTATNVTLWAPIRDALRGVSTSSIAMLEAVEELDGAKYVIAREVVGDAMVAVITFG